jgi:outer membrane receptor protein involved in Fe transport
MDASKGLNPVTSRISGGDQNLTGAFVQDVITPTSKLQVTLSARLDHWRNYNPHNFETNIATGAATINNRPPCSTTGGAAPCLADRSDTVGSPRAAALYHVTDRVGVWGDYGLGFRAPTLNELYRQFSVGAVVTRANDQLGPEHLKGGELGLNLEPVKDLTTRLTWFDNRMKDPISNVTIGNNLQQRQNLGRTRIAGLQFDSDYRLARWWKINASYLYERARVVESSATLGLPAGTNLATNCPGPNAAGTAAGTGTGEACYLQQVPKNRGALRVAYSNPRYFMIAVGVQWIGAQFDDDQNARVIPAAALADAGYPAIPTPITDASLAGLPKYTLFDLIASRSIGRNFEAFLSVENLTDKQYFAGTVPTLLGPPRMVTGGIRVKWQAK